MSCAIKYHLNGILGIKTLNNPNILQIKQKLAKTKNDISGTNPDKKTQKFFNVGTNNQQSLCFQKIKNSLEIDYCMQASITYHYADESR